MNWLIKKLLKFTGSQKFLSVQLDITNKCNLKCVHCYHPAQASEELPFSEWQKILDQYGALMGKLCLKPCFAICGGEPTVSQLFSPILDEVKVRWPESRIILITNGTTLTCNIISEIRRHGVEVTISLDGPDPERHDSIRGKGAFDRVIESCRSLRVAGIPFGFQAVLSFRTRPWIGDFFKCAVGMKASSMCFARFVAQGRGKVLAEKQVDRPLAGLELRSAFASILESSRETGVSTATNLPLFVLLGQGLGAHGKAGFQGLVVDYKGNLKLTSRADFRLGNILEDGLENLFLNNQVMKDLRAGRIEGCGTCEYYDRCGGDRNASFVEYGSFLKKDPGCWLQPGTTLGE